MKLNFPTAYAIKLSKTPQGIFVYDIVRRKNIVLTPEEWVRQHFLHHLIADLGYPKSLIKVESGLHYNQLQKRSDILVYSADGIPFILVECKAPDIILGHSAWGQVAAYQHGIKANMVVLTNGKQHLYFRKENDTEAFEQIPALPPYRGSKI